MIIRAATLADLARIAAIKVENWADTYTPLLDPDTLRPFLDEPLQRQYIEEKAALPDTLLLVAEDGARGVVGFALTFVNSEPDPWMESLHVLAENRGHGSGTLLMRATATELLGRGRKSMQLGVIVGNEQAARYYERLGAELVTVEPVTWAAGVQHMVYRWPDVTVLAR